MDQQPEHDQPETPMPDGTGVDQEHVETKPHQEEPYWEALKKRHRCLWHY